jgi:hypothetical protein
MRIPLPRAVWLSTPLASLLALSVTFGAAMEKPPGTSPSHSPPPEKVQESNGPLPTLLRHIPKPDLRNRGQALGPEYELFGPDVKIPTVTRSSI